MALLLRTTKALRAPSSAALLALVLLISLALVVQITKAEWKAIDKPCKCQQFRCSTGICLHAQRVCDGNRDCPGGEDEVNSFMKNGKCRRQKAKCSDDEFPCKFGDCIKLTQVCDGTIDCWGAVDESSDFCEWVHNPNTTRRRRR